MKNHYKQLSSTVCLLAVIFYPLSIIPQNKRSGNGGSWVSPYPEKEKRCLAQKISTARTYTLERIDREKAYGPRQKKWFDPLKKIIPFWNNGEDEKFSHEAINKLDKNFGLTAPLGETDRSKEIRLEMHEKLARQEVEGEKNWAEWLKQNPNVDAAERKEAEFRIRFQGFAIEKLPDFDWREFGLDVGRVGTQGENCNTCWAFAALDAFEINRRLNAKRANKFFITGIESPSVRQLLSCMVTDRKFCDFKKPGEAFTFMVDIGTPLGGSNDYGRSDSNPDTSAWTCEKTDSLKALTWDYVSGEPYKVPTEAEIKRAIITYGSVVSMINFDDCLSLYDKGVFNEEQNYDGSHLLLIIGWDDAKGAWLVKNSYGEDWGEKGFAWIKYGSNNIGQFAAYVVADPQEETKFWLDAATPE